MNEKEIDCCPRFESINWDDKIFEWKDKPFIRGKVKTFMYMPVGFGKVMTSLQQKVDAAGATIPDYLCLSDHTSKWNMDILLAVSKPIDGADNISLTGKFYSKAYEGPFKDTGKWSEDFKSILTTKGYTPKKWYMWYTTCPKCAKKYGKNYVVIIAEI